MLDLIEVSPKFSFGSIVRGLTLAQLDNLEIREELHRVWYDRGLLIFRGGDTSIEFQVQLSAVFGPLMQHQNVEKLVGGHPELVKLTADPDEDFVVEVDGEIRFGVLPWHGDARWIASPPHGGLLRVHHMPSTGGETGFIDLISAYERLPDRLKQAIEGKASIVRLVSDPNIIFKFQQIKPRIISIGGAAKRLGDRAAQRPGARPDFPPIVQSLVYTQPETGRKVLGFTPLPVQQIIGLTPEESEALLYELSGYVTDEANAYVHTWLQDDLVLWDNLRLLHKAYGVPKGETREVWRTTIGGGYAVARPLDEADGGFSWNSVAAE